MDEKDKIKEIKRIEKIVVNIKLGALRKGRV